MSKINIIGLTGPTGSGKTEASKIFAQFGFKVINADVVAKAVLDNNTECKKKLMYAYGNNIVGNEGQIKREVLAKCAFKNKEKANLLNSITHPYIVKDIEDKIVGFKKENLLWVLLDAPLLFESQLNTMCSLTVSILASKTKRLKRIMKRDRIDINVAMNRINIQQNEEFYLEKSDYVLYNNDTDKVFNKEIKDFILKIKGESI